MQDEINMTNLWCFKTRRLKVNAYDDIDLSQEIGRQLLDIMTEALSISSLKFMKLLYVLLIFSHFQQKS